MRHMDYITLAPHAQRQIAADKITAASQKAKAAAARYGEDAVINSTMGECHDDEGHLMVMPTVARLLREADIEDYCSYAPLGGVTGFNEAVQTTLFGDVTDRWFVESVPTPGGCGALRHAIWNFLEDGEAALTSDYCWGPYRSICEEHGRRLRQFELLGGDGAFNLQSMRAEAEAVLKEQPRLLLILNTPANNPTGYSMTKAEMEKVMTVLRDLAADKSRKITLCIDVSYIDFAGSFEQSRQIFDAITDIPENMMVTLIFSMSKSYSMCGMRCGAIVCLSPDEAAADCFRQVMGISSRSTWSNVTRLPQTVMVKICSDPELKAQVDREREVFKKIIAERARAFLDYAEEYGVRCCHYDSGYFIAIPCSDPERVAGRLQEQNVYVVPLKKALRFSPCAVTKEKCLRAIRIIKNVMEEVER